MIREMVKIDNDLCDGCGLCIPNCHEGALQIIDEKAVLISDLMCDGLGACLGHCPQGAITIEKREAEPYDEIKVMEEMVKKGENVVLAHLQHMEDHNETEFLNEGIAYIKEHKEKIDFDVDKLLNKLKNKEMTHNENPLACGCPGSEERSFNAPAQQKDVGSVRSELVHWPVQMHLLNPNAPHFKNSDLLIAADCVAFSMGDFHGSHLKGKTLGIACPKLDTNTDIYIEKITALIDEAKVNSITTMVMEVPCCGGLIQMINEAVSRASRKVPVKKIVIGVQGQILSDEWL